MDELLKNASPKFFRFCWAKYSILNGPHVCHILYALVNSPHNTDFKQSKSKLLWGVKYMKMNLCLVFICLKVFTDKKVTLSEKALSWQTVRGPWNQHSARLCIKWIGFMNGRSSTLYSYQISLSFSVCRLRLVVDFIMHMHALCMQ